MQKLISRLSIRSIIIASFLPLILLVIFTYYGFYRVGSSQLEQQAYANAANINTQISRSLEQTLENVYQTASVAVSNPLFFRMKTNIEANRSPVISPSNYYSLSQMLDNLINSNPDYFRSVSLFLNDYSILVYRSEIADSIVKINFRYDDYRDNVSTKSLTWILPQEQHPYQLISGHYSSLGLMILLGTPDSKLRGFLLFELNDSLLEKEVQNAIITPDSRFFILNGSDPLISGPDAHEIPSTVSDQITWNITGETTRLRGSSDIFFCTPSASLSPGIRLEVLSQVPLKDIRLNQRPLTVALILIILLLLAICGCSYLLIYVSVSRPLQRLNRGLRKNSVLSDHPEFLVHGCAEITTINQTLNQYVARTRQLVGELNHEMNERCIAELNILYEQINPHFLYNALDTIYQLCDLNDMESAKKMTSSLATFYRIGVSKGANYIRLEEEFAHAAGFLSVMEIRFADFTYEAQLPETLKSCYTVKMILQPILENAIYHGIHPLFDRMGHIDINAQETEQGIQIKVTDNGVGMEKQQLDEIRLDLDTEFQSRQPGKLYGLKNVHKRLRLTFGKPYGLAIDSKPDCQTTVTILIPKLTDVSDTDLSSESSDGKTISISPGT